MVVTVSSETQWFGGKEMSQYLAPVSFMVVLLVNFSLLGWLQRKASMSPARQKGERHVISYSSALRACVVGYAILMAVALMGCFLIVSRMEGPYAANIEGLFTFVAIFALFLLAPSVLHVFSARIEYDATHVYTFSPWGADRAVLWSDIAGYSVARVMKQHILRTKGGDDIRFGVLLSGYQNLLEEARGHKISGL